MIGVGITTTPNRNVLANTLDYLRRFQPSNSYLCVYNDNEYRGVAHSKNRLLQYLEHCNDIFIFDDDCHPIADNWWVPYVESKEPHMMYQFKLPGKPETDMRELYRDEKIVSYSHTRGAMIYVNKIVLDTVGGMDESYGQAMFEHPDWTNRIYNAGLTTYRSMDVPNSHELFYCLDQDTKVESSIPDKVRKDNELKNFRYYRSHRNSKEYKEFKHD